MWLVQLGMGCGLGASALIWVNQSMIALLVLALPNDSFVIHLYAFRRIQMRDWTGSCAQSLLKMRRRWPPLFSGR